MGNLFFKNNYVVFDFEAPRVGFVSKSEEESEQEWRIKDLEGQKESSARELMISGALALTMLCLSLIL